MSWADRFSKVLAEWADAERTNVRFFGGEYKAQLKMLVRLHEDHQKTEHADPSAAEIDLKKLDVITAVVKSFREFQGMSPGTTASNPSKCEARLPRRESQYFGRLHPTPLH